MRRPLIIIVALVALFIGCTERKYSNPLDPRNPETKGRPTGLRVYSVLDSVFLSWNRLDLEDLKAVRIWRATDHGQFALLAELPSGSGEYMDPDVEYDHTYRYFVTVVGADFESPPSDTVDITPGPTSVLLVDSYVGSVARFTHDGKHIVWESSYAPYPYDVVVDSRRQKVWVPDALESSVQCLAFRSGRFLFRVVGFWHPWRLALEKSTGAILVADYLGGLVSKIDTEGAELWRDDRFERPLDVAPSVGGGFWVMDEERKTVVRYEGPGGAELQRCPFELRSPRALDADAKGMSLWVADGSAIYRYDYRTRTWTAVMGGLSSVRAISCSPTGDQCWVLDRATGSDYASRILKIDASGAVLVESRGWGGASDLDWNWYDGGCAVADRENGRLVLLDTNGRVRGVYEGLVRPTYVEVE